ncbi:hypothetical protein CCHR01_00644 [Colletotrichum chrysophilum]|uniref:Uncharacterized protein n=1 Tax=Colletotrichum chrysophilum TaxID=1836956 RepID=A0AAD9B0Q8_9PEZI|nr:hypothetical protein CCHR01_00644 [Colletotrichum chrysophilum]
MPSYVTSVLHKSAYLPPNTAAFVVSVSPVAYSSHTEPLTADEATCLANRGKVSTLPPCLDTGHVLPVPLCESPWTTAPRPVSLRCRAGRLEMTAALSKSCRRLSSALNAGQIETRLGWVGIAEVANVEPSRGLGIEASAAGGR